MTQNNDDCVGGSIAPAVDQSTDPPTTGLLDAVQVAAMLGTPLRFVRRLVEERRIECIRVGRYVRFEPETVRKWIAANKQAAR